MPAFVQSLMPPSREESERRSDEFYENLYLHYMASEHALKRCLARERNLGDLDAERCEDISVLLKTYIKEKERKPDLKRAWSEDLKRKSNSERDADSTLSVMHNLKIDFENEFQKIKAFRDWRPTSDATNLDKFRLLAEALDRQAAAIKEKKPIRPFPKAELSILVEFTGKLHTLLPDGHQPGCFS